MDITGDGQSRSDKKNLIKFQCKEDVAELNKK